MGVEGAALLPHEGQEVQAASKSSSSALNSAPRAGCSDHGCWAYSTRSERDAAAVQWLLKGAKLRQRLIAVTADRDAGVGLLAAISDSPDAKSLQPDVIHFSIDQLFDLSPQIDAEAQLEGYTGEVARAVADGFNGIRAFCDITPLIADPARRASHARWEHMWDAWMAEGNPLAPLCAYDMSVVGDQPQGVMAVHPRRHGAQGVLPQFGLYCGSSTRVLEGEIDLFSVPALAESLAALPEGRVDLDASGLTFLCVRGAATLADGCDGAKGPSQLRLIGAPPIVRRMWEILGFDMRILASRAI